MAGRRSSGGGESDSPFRHTLSKLVKGPALQFFFPGIRWREFPARRVRFTPNEQFLFSLPETDRKSRDTVYLRDNSVRSPLRLFAEKLVAHRSFPCWPSQ